MREEGFVGEIGEIGVLNLRVVDVAGCSLGACGATTLAAALALCPLLEELQCSRNYMRADGAPALASTLPL